MNGRRAKALRRLAANCEPSNIVHRKYKVKHKSTYLVDPQSRAFYQYLKAVAKGLTIEQIKGAL